MTGAMFGASRCEGLFHVHSTFSSDGKLSLAELRSECLGKGLHFMVVTDHAEDFGPAELRRYVAECRALSGSNFLAVPGLEFRLPEKEDIHLLVAGWDNSLIETPEAPTSGILSAALGARNGWLVVLAHPWKTRCSVPPEIEPALNGVEIWNASCDSRYLPDHRAIRTYIGMRSRNPALIGIGGLDLHDRSGFRGLRIRLRGACRDTAHLLSIIRSGDFETAGVCLKVRSSPEYGSTSLALLSAGRRFLDAADRLISRAGVFRK